MFASFGLNTGAYDDIIQATREQRARDEARAIERSALKVRRKTEEVPLQSVLYPLVVHTTPGRNPYNSDSDLMRRLADGRHNSDPNIQENARKTLQARHDFFLEDLSRQLGDEDTVFCASSGELALRVTNVLLNASTEEEAKLCFVAYKPAHFHYNRVGWKDVHQTHATKTAVEELKDLRSVQNRDLRWCRTPKELEEFASNPYWRGQELCFVSSCGTVVGLLTNSVTRTPKLRSFKSSQQSSKRSSPFGSQSAGHQLTSPGGEHSQGLVRGASQTKKESQRESQREAERQGQRQARSETRRLEDAFLQVFEKQARAEEEEKFDTHLEPEGSALVELTDRLGLYYNPDKDSDSELKLNAHSGSRERGVIAVYCPHEVLRFVFNFPGYLLVEPVYSLRYGAFDPYEIDRWLLSRNQAEDWVRDLIENPATAFTRAEAIQSLQVAFPEATLRVNLAKALAMANSPAEFSLLLLGRPDQVNEATSEKRALYSANFLKDRAGELLLQTLPAKDSRDSAKLCLSACGDWLYLGGAYAGMTAVAQKAQEDNSEELQSPVGCLIDSWDRLTILYGPPLHLVCPLPLGKPVRLSNYLRVSPLSAHTPEPNRIQEISERDKAEAKKVALSLTRSAGRYLGEEDKNKLSSLISSSEDTVVPITLLTDKPTQAQREAVKQAARSETRTTYTTRSTTRPGGAAQRGKPNASQDRMRKYQAKAKANKNKLSSLFGKKLG